MCLVVMIQSILVVAIHVTVGVLAVTWHTRVLFVAAGHCHAC
jgi:hypothetical protein